MEKTVFTVGHSNHTLEYFLKILQLHRINCIIDVRSVPYSRIVPQFNKDLLVSSLKINNIVYAHFAKEFGARHTKLSLLDENGKVDFDKIRASDEFKQGVVRLENALRIGYRVALMCSEANPFDCHRFSMISYQLVKEQMQIYHILQNGALLDNRELENRLLRKYCRQLPVSTLFETVTLEMQLENAYRLRGKDIAFSANRLQEADSLDVKEKVL